MNHTYRVVYNETTNTYTAVAEIATAKGKSSKSKKVIAAAIMVALQLVPLTVQAAIAIDSTTGSYTTGGRTYLLGSTQGATATGENAIAIGSNASARSQTSVAVGKDAEVSGKFGIAIGNNSRALAGENTVAIGSNATVTNNEAIALGANTNVSGNQTIAIGMLAQGTGNQSVALGANTIVSGDSSIAIGGDDLDEASKKNFDSTYSSGGVNGGKVNERYKEISGQDLVDTNRQYVGTTASGTASVAVGVQAESLGHLSTAFGTKTKAIGLASTAIGIAANSQGEGSIAVGPAANAVGLHSNSIGAQSIANGQDSIAIGTAANASTINSVIIGQGATSNNFHNAVAIGAKAETATSDWAQNGSVHAQYRNPYNVVTNTRVVGGVAPREGYTGDTAISNNGYQVVMSSAVAVGYNAKADNSGVAIGSDATVTRTNNAGGAARALGIAIGANALSAGGGVVIGASASTSGVNAIAVGRQATAANASAQAYGASSAAVGQGALAMGHSATSLGTRSIAIGMSTKDEYYDYDGRVIAAGNNSIAFGSHARAGKLTQEGSITNLDAQGNPTNESKYILDKQDSSVERATAIGYYANASAVDAIAFGSNATVSGNQSIAIGTGNKVSGNSAGAFGDPSFIAGDNSYSLGNNHVIANNSNNAISIGGQNKLGGDAPRTASGEVDATKDIDDIKNAAAGASYSMVIGFNNTVNADNVMVLGNNISVEANKDLSGSVILGQNAGTSGSHAIANVTNATVNGITYGDFAGTVKDKGRFVSVGAVGDERKIINVAAGNISATSTEAINGSQLYLVANGLKDAMPTVTAAGENTTITSTTHANGSVTYTVDAKDTDTQVTVVAGKGVAVNSDDKNTNGTTIYNVSAKVDGSTVTINDAGEITAKTGDITTTTDGTVKLGDTVNGNSLVNASTVVDAINNASFAVNSKNTEDQVVANNGNTTVKAGSNITYQAGKNLVVNQTGDVIAFGLTESINVTNVTATDTIRIGDTGPSISTTGIDAAGKTITNVAPGTNGTDAVNLDQLNASKSVVEAGDNTTVTSVTNKDGSITYTVNAKAGEGADGDTQVTVVAGKGVAVNSDDKNTNGTTIYNVSAKVDGSTVTINDAGEITAKTGDITTTTDGTVKLGDTVNGNSLVNASTVVDAINNASFAVNSKNTEDQVVANNGNTTVKAGSNITYQAGKNLVVNQTGDVIAFGLTESINVTNVTATDTIRIGDTGPSISTTGIDAAGKTITNVAPGTNGTDAVNLDQLNASKSVVEAGDNTTVTSVTNKDGSITYTVNAKAGEGADGDTQVTVVAGKGVAVNSDDKNTNGTTIYNVSAKVDGSTVTINDAGEITAKTGDITTTDGTVKLGDTVNGNSLVNASTVVDAINNASFAVNSKNTEDQVVAKDGNTTVKAGSNITYQAGKNLVVNQTGDVIAFGLTESINVTNVTATDTIRIGDTGPSISTTGIDAAGNTITNVAPGTNGTDAVNLDQLNASKSVVEAGDNTTVTSVTNKDGSITYTVNAKAGEGADGDTQVTVVAGKGVAVNSDDKNTNGTTIYNVSAKVDGSTVTINDAGEITANTGNITTNTDGTVKLGDNVNGDSLVNASTVVDAINNASWNLSENGVNKDAVQPGDTVNFVDGTYTTANISSDGNVSNVTFNVNGTKLVSDNSPVVYTDKDGNKVYSDGKGGFVYANGTTVNNGDVIASMNNGDNSTTTPMSLTNVANGTISNTSTDAINGSQLYALGDTTANIIGGNSTFNTTTGGIDGFTLNTTYANGTTYGSPSTTIGDAITNLNKYVNEGWKVGDSTGTEVANVTPGEQVNFVNSSTLVSKVTPNATTGAADVTFEIVSGQIDANPNGTVVNNGTGLVTNTDVINAINNSGWNLTTNNNASNETLINPGETVSINAGSNMEVTQDGNNVTVATKENVTFTNVHANNSVSIGNTTTGDTVNMTVTNGTNGSPALTLNNSTGGPVQITNVAAGDVSANSTDAINGSQLYQIYQVVGGNTQNVSTTNVTLDNGENVSVAVSNNYTMMTYNVKDQTEYLTNDVIEAIGRMNEEGIKFFHTNDENVNKSSIQHNNSVDSSAAGAYSTAIGSRAKANGEHSLAIGSSIGINVTTLPNGTKVYSSTQDTVAEAESSIAFGHGVNVTATATQAIGIGYANIVSGEQAIALGQNATVTGNQSISIGYGNKVTGNNSGAFGDPSIVNGNSSYSVGNNNNVSTNSTYALGSNITNTTDNSVFLGDASGVFEQNSSTLNNATGAHEALNTTASAYTYQNVNSTQVKGVDDVVGVVSVGNATATRQIQGVAAGVISSDSTDAINGSQLYNSLQEFTAKSSLTISTNGGNPTSVAGGNINFNNGNGTTVVHDGNNITINTPMTYVDDAGNATHNTTNDVTFIGTPKTDANGDTIVDQNGKPVYNNVTIHNVAPGVLDNDAVNVSQLKQVANNLNNKIDNVADDADAGTASAMATAGLPQVFEAGKSMVAVAGSTYRGKQGYAVGFSAITDGGNWIIKGTASGNSKGHFGATVGAGYQW
ncbi:YadA-like family protein [Wielerella bovis]|uniref:YadA-like family protein n=1 Tax=Wielerella bovis TaxID=2917790 RepID=UPI0020192911|nr:YadA-like family protein [Wielerella bovis]ULJ60450.1 YadA-like family protein [Wielerella bovis]